MTLAQALKQPLPWVALAAALAIVLTQARQATDRPAEGGNLDNMSAVQEPLSVRTEEAQYFEKGIGFYAAPEKPGDYPGVVVIHEWWGLNDYIKQSAALLAGQGYRVLAVDLYGGKVATTPVEAQEYRSSLTREESDANLKAAVEYLKRQGASKVASLGWCFGGGKSLELALSGVPLDATVIYYGNLVTDQEALRRIDWPVLGIFGAKDLVVPVESVYAFEEALKALGKTHSINIYPDVGHAFANPSGQNYAPEATKDAWEKTLRFLDENLR